MCRVHGVSDQNASYHATIVRLRQREVTGEREFQPSRLLVRGVGQLRVPQLAEVAVWHLEHLNAAQKYGVRELGSYEIRGIRERKRRGIVWESRCEA